MNNIINNQSLVYFIIEKYFKNSVKFDSKNTPEDYFQIGMIGLVKADKKYKSEKGKFSTFACKCIFNEICSFLKKEQKSGKEFTNINVYNSLNSKLVYTENFNEEFCEKVLSVLSGTEQKYIEKMINGSSKKDALKSLNIKDGKKFLQNIKQKLHEENIIVQ